MMDGAESVRSGRSERSERSHRSHGSSHHNHHRAHHHLNQAQPPPQSSHAQHRPSSSSSGRPHSRHGSNRDRDRDRGDRDRDDRSVTIKMPGQESDLESRNMEERIEVQVRLAAQDVHWRPQEREAEKLFTEIVGSSTMKINQIWPIMADWALNTGYLSYILRVQGKRNTVSVSLSRLWNCGNLAKYICWPHKWKASVPVHPQKMRTVCIFQQPVWPFFSGLKPGIVCVTFND